MLIGVAASTVGGAARTIKDARSGITIVKVGSFEYYDKKVEKKYLICRASKYRHIPIVIVMTL